MIRTAHARTGSVFWEAVDQSGLSLRYKILLLLTVIPLVMLGAYLVLAIRVFETDKVAYVFDSSSSMSSTMAAQIKAQLNSVLMTARPLFQDFLGSVDGAGRRRFSPDGDRLFRTEPLLDAIGAYRQRPNGQFEPVALLEKESKFVEKLVKALGVRASQDFAQAALEGRALRVPFGDDRVVVYEKFAEKNEVVVFFVVTRLSEVQEMLRTALSHETFLISRGGDIHFGPARRTEKNLSAIAPLSILRDRSVKVNQGAESVDSPSGERLLASFARVGFGDLIIVTLVEKSKALAAVGILVRKSLIFFAILLCLTVIISLFASDTITKALGALLTATQRVAEGKFDIRVDVRSNDEVGTLAKNFNTMAAEVARLMDQTAEQARMESELQTARTVQETLFPEAKSKVGPLEVAGFYEPASECGGDWWHYCEVNGKIFLWIGDATGHGVGAALITSAAKSASSIIEHLNIDPASAMALLNRSICDVSKGRVMMTFFLAAYDPATSILTYANASHEAPLLIKKGSKVLKKKDLVPLNDVVGPRLGQSRETLYEQATVQLDPEDAIFFYTDGVPDVQSPKKETWGEREFIKALIAANKDFPPADTSVTRLLRAIQSFRQRSQLVDDVTFFVVKNKSMEGARNG